MKLTQSVQHRKKSVKMNFNGFLDDMVSCQMKCSPELHHIQNKSEYLRWASHIAFAMKRLV